MYAGAAISIVSALSSGADQASAYKKQATAEKAQSEFAAKTLEQNASFADEGAQDAIKRGDINAERLLTESRGTIGAQRASFGAQGVDVGSGSALAVQNDVTDQSRIDADTIRSNAMKEAMGIQFSASQSRQQAAFARMSGTARADAMNNAASTSLATGGLKAASAYADYRRNRAPTA